MLFNLLWDAILCGCTLGLAVVGKVQDHEFGEAVEELSIAEYISWPEQTAGLFRVLCVIDLTSGPVVHGTYTLLCKPGQHKFILAFPDIMTIG